MASTASTSAAEELTPLRAHYLKRELVALQVAREVVQLEDADSLGLLGPPFSPPKRPAPDADTPFLSFCFAHFVTTFPFLARAPQDFYSRKLQTFVDSFLARNISASDDRDEDTKRKRLAGRLEKHLGLIISSAVKLQDNGGRETVIRVGPDGAVVAEVGRDGLVAPDPRVSLIATTEAQSDVGMMSAPPSKSLPNLPGAKSIEFDVNVVTIRVIVQRGRIRSKSHEEFVVRTRRAGQADVHVSRRYGDFNRLAEALRNEFHEADIRPPPPKDRRSSEAKTDGSPRVSGEYQDSTPPSPDSSFKPEKAPILARERNRLTLRAYLRYLLGNPAVASSDTMREFLLNDPISLTTDEQRGIEVREEMDRHREQETLAFRAEVESRVRELEQYLRTFREELVKRDGLSRVFSTIKTTEHVQDLPIEYRKLLEWARISLASTIYSLFVGSDNSSNVFQQLKRIHGLMPYFMIRGILRISNPVAMIRAFLDLFLARPFGSTSLLQRMFAGGLTEEVKELHEDMDLVAQKIGNPGMIAKVEAYINASREKQQKYRDEAMNERLDIMAVILRSADEPRLDPISLQRVARCNYSYLEYLRFRASLDNPDEDDHGPNNDDAWLFEDLHVWKRLATRARDKEQLVELIFEGTTSELLKDMISIFYQPLATVYRAANVADSIVDLQAFINDLIKTVEAAEHIQLVDPQRTVKTFIDLVQRHEGRFYHFVHQVHTKGAALFDDLMHWIERFITFVRDGLPDPISLEVLLPHTGPERVAILAEVDQVVEYHRRLKAAHHERMKRRLIKGEAKENDGDLAFIEGVMSDMELGAVAADVDDLQAAESDEEHDEGSSEEGSFVDATDDPKEGSAEQPMPPSKRKRGAIEMPELVHLPQLSAIFVEMIRPSLHAARTAPAPGSAASPTTADSHARRSSSGSYATRSPPLPPRR